MRQGTQEGQFSCGNRPISERERKILANPDRFKDTEKRQIDLPSVEVSFSTLKEGRDCETMAINSAVESERPIQDYYVFVNPTKGDRNRKVNPPHWRTSSEEGKVFVRRKMIVKRQIENEKVPFYDVNTKGVGFLKPFCEGISLDDYDKWITTDDEGEHEFGYIPLGMASQSEFSGKDIIAKSNQLLEAGLRTEVFWSMAELKQVPYKGEMRPIKELKEEEVVIKNPKWKPVIAVRLLKTNTRIEEAAKSEERRRQIFTDAFETFNKETDDCGLPFPMLDAESKEHQEIFFKEFFRRMGQNIAALLNIGYSHYRLHGANITMAAEIADIGTMNYWKLEKKDPDFHKEYNGVRRMHLKDMRDSVYGLKRLLEAAKLAGLSTGNVANLVDSFIAGFDEKLNAEHVRKIQKTNPENARKWMEKIISAVIVDKKRLPALQTNQVEDWGIRI